MASPYLASALVTTGFATLALAGVMGLLGLASAELENAAQAVAWSTGAFFVGLLGALAAAAGGFLRMRSA